MVFNKFIVMNIKRLLMMDLLILQKTCITYQRDIKEIPVNEEKTMIENNKQKHNAVVYFIVYVS